MDKHDTDMTRRGFLQATLGGASALALGGGASLAGATAGVVDATTSSTAIKIGDSKPLPTRPLGKTGQNVTILAMGGGMQSMDVQFIERVWALGVRYFDTAAGYKKGQGEQLFGSFFAKHPELRKEAFFVTRGEHIHKLSDLPKDVDARLEQSSAGYLDAYFLNGVGPSFGKTIGMDPVALLKSPELKDIAEKLKASGKIKHIGFSCHEKRADLYLQAAAEGGVIEVIMHSYDPFQEKGGAMDKAMDACHKAGIGLVSMKTARMAISKVPAKLPQLEKLGLTTRQGLLHAAWSDERLSSVCVGIDNLQHGEENAQGARLYKKPLTMAQMDLMHETVLASLPTMCPGCDGRCAEAAGKRELALNDIARMVSYYEMDGNEEARELYQALAAHERDASGADLAAAGHACMNRLDFAAILEKAKYYFG
jgi:predicted aldo/keto reductase-like oxidoreductase